MTGENRKMKSKKKFIFKIFIIICFIAFAGCVFGLMAKNGIFAEQVTISIGSWPNDTDPERYEDFENLKTAFKKQYPNIKIEPSTYVPTIDTYGIMAEEKKLPNLYSVYFTETNKIIEKGYAADITDELEKMGWKKFINPEILSLLVDKDGRVYGIPYEVYVQGLYINKKIFREAGLVNPDGSIMVPQNLDEMAEYAGIIKEKTGKAGFVMPTTENCGGWHFLNIAWNFGVRFMKSDGAGNYISTFDTEETRKALQYVKDLKHVYNALPEEMLINIDEMNKLFITGQAGMLFMNPLSNHLITNYGMSKEDIMVARIPEGEAGRCAQIGGTVWMFSKESTSQQIMAGLKWLEARGLGPVLTDEQMGLFENNIKKFRDEGRIILDRQIFDVWTDYENNKKVNEIYSRYSNVDPEDYEDYLNFRGVKLRPEEPTYCQDLYAILDKCIQEVIKDENADVASLVKNANEEFQNEFLNKGTEYRLSE